MQSRQSHTDYSPKPRGYRFWLGCFTLLLGSPLLLYYGYCWGVWGRHSLLLQYLFQCNCPSASEEARYPDEVDVMISACRYVSSRLSPSGGLLYVNEKSYLSTSAYLLDLRTKDKIPFALQESAFYFLNDDLLYVFMYYKGDQYILDRITGEKYPIRRFTSVYPDAAISGSTNLSLLAAALHEARYVFLIKEDDIVVALASDFPASPERSFLTGWYDIPGFETDRVEQFLKTNNVFYQTILENFPDEVVSRDGRFVARADGIYLLGSGEKIVEAPTAGREYLSVRGWVNDGSGVIYSRFSDPCLIETNFVFDNSVCIFAVSQPVLNLKLPKDYLRSGQSP